MGQNWAVQRFQNFHRRVRVGEALEVGDIGTSLIFLPQAGSALFNLRGDGSRGSVPALCKLSASASTAKSAAAVASGAIPVGTGKSSVDGNFVDFLTETVLKILICRIDSMNDNHSLFIRVQQR